MPRLAPLAAAGVVVALTVGTAQVKPTTFTDTRLKNGLRVIISEDHSAPAAMANAGIG